MPPGARVVAGSCRRKGLLPGEPVTPMLHAVLKAANRPLSSSDAAPALLKARGLEYRDDEVTAIVTWMSALLVQEAPTGRVGRAPTDDKRRRLLIWTRRTTEEPRDAADTDRSPDLARDGTSNPDDSSVETITVEGEE